jgi:aspartate kinase
MIERTLPASSHAKPFSRILKFGGTSVATAPRRAAVAEIVRRAHRRGPVVVVTSALAGVTDRLQQALSRAVAGELPAAFLDDLRRRHLQDAGGSPAMVEARRRFAQTLAGLEKLLTGVALLGECPAAARHRCLAAGERLALPLVVAALEDAGLRATGADGAALLVAACREPDGEPEIDLDASRARTLAARRRLEQDEVAVVTGFVAGDGRGGTVTLGRGASDLSATLLAAFLDAEAVEIWSDVDGLLSGPPRHLPEASPLAAMSYGEAAAMALYGARVLHPEALAPVAAAGIPVWIRNTLTPESPGTRIDGGPDEETMWTAPAAVTMVPASRLRLRGPWHRRDLPSRVLAVLERRGVRPLLVDPGVPGGILEVVVAATAAATVEDALRDELAGGDVFVDRQDVAVVAAVGRGSGTAGETLRTLQDQGIRTLAVSGSAGTTVAVVGGADGPRAVACLHEALAAGRTLLPHESLTPLAPLSHPLPFPRERGEPDPRIAHP